MIIDCLVCVLFTVLIVFMESEDASDGDFFQRKLMKYFGHTKYI